MVSQKELLSNKNSLYELKIFGAIDVAAKEAKKRLKVLRNN